VRNLGGETRLKEKGCFLIVKKKRLPGREKKCLWFKGRQELTQSNLSQQLREGDKKLRKLGDLTQLVKGGRKQRKFLVRGLLQGSAEKEGGFGQVL